MAKTKHPAPEQQPTRATAARPVFAAIDVGATAVRMQIAQLGAERQFEILEHLVHPIAIGSDTFQQGYVSPATGRALGEVLVNFQRVLEQYGVASCRAVGTSAIREATNKDVLLDRVHHQSGFRLEVLDAAEESRLTYQILLPFLEKQDLDEPETRTLVLDLGGGSTEIVVLEGKHILLAGNSRIGTARLFHGVYRRDSQDAQAVLESMIHNVVSTAHDLYRHVPIRECLIINSLLAKALAGHPEAETLPRGLVVPAGVLRSVARDAAGATPEALVNRFAIGLAEAELLLPALRVSDAFLDTMAVTRIFLPEVDLIDGLFIDQAMRHAGEDPIDAFRGEILRSVQSLAEKYQAGGSHCLQVTRLGRQLFDGLADYLDLDRRDRLYLEVGSILHDVGRFIDDCDHHKHGAYIVWHSEIVGFGEAERDLVALLVRYHRKGRPRETHPEFARLSTEQRLRVAKLASLLRIADALDRDHEERVRQLEIRLGEEHVDILCEATSDLAVEKAALVRKGTLFEDLTGLRIRLRRHLA